MPRACRPTTSWGKFSRGGDAAAVVGVYRRGRPVPPVSSPAPASRGRSPLLPIFLIVLVDVLGMTLVIPLLAIYALRFGASELEGTLLFSTFAVCQLFAGPVIGALSDRYGRRKVLLVTQLGTLAGFLILANANALWMMFLGRTIDGVTAGNLTVAQAVIADHTPPEKRASSFALIGIAFGLGFTVGPAISAALAGHSLAAPFWLAAGLSGLAILGTLFILPPDAPASARPDAAGYRRASPWQLGTYVAFFRTPVLGARLLQFFVYMFAFWMFTGGFPLFAKDNLVWGDHPFSVREIGYTMALSGVIGALVQGGALRRMVPRFGEATLATAGFALFAIGYLLLGLVPGMGLLALATASSALGNAVLRPCLTALVSQLADARQQGAVLGVTQSLSSIAAITAPPLSGLLIGHGLGPAWAVVAAGVCVLGLALGLGRRAPRAPAAPT
jgi:DHA1 family tetracycline resistance protein-like MFS transporter